VILSLDQDLATPDALQLASAFEVGSDFLFLTNDNRFRKVPGLKVAVPA